MQYDADMEVAPSRASGSSAIGSRSGPRAVTGAGAGGQQRRSSLGSRQQQQQQSPINEARAPRTLSKPPVPTAADLSSIPTPAPRAPRNYVVQNTEAAIRSSEINSKNYHQKGSVYEAPPRDAPRPAGPGLKQVHESFGRVPEYLKERQAQMAAEVRYVAQQMK